MQATSLRYLTLAAVVGVAVWLSASSSPSAASGGRWPSEERVYLVPGWAVSPASIDDRWGIHYLTRSYVGPGDAQAWLTLASSPEAKLIYRAGAEVPLLGDGYVVEEAPPAVREAAAGLPALIGQQGDQRWLTITAFGERRGVLGNGAAAWSMATLDSLVAQPNDYYRATVATRLGEHAESNALEAARLAARLASNISQWYGSDSTAPQ